MSPSSVEPRRQAEPRRLLFTTTATDFGGTESFLLHLLSRLDRTRFDPLVCSLRPHGFIGEQIAALGIPVLDLGMAEDARPHQLLLGAFRLARLIDAHRIELVQSLLYRANLVSALAARLARHRPVLVSGQRSLVPKRAWLAAFAVRRTRRLAQRVVAVSGAVARELAATEHLDPQQVVVIPNGVDTAIFQPRDGAAIRARWGVPPGALVVGAVGRLSHTKGLVHLIDAVAALGASGREVVLMLAGSGSEQKTLEERARRAGVERAVRFLGFCVRLEEIYPGFNLYALPSLAEGSPNALLEAMACGLPAVASAVGGVPEIVDDGASGLLVPPADPEALTAALARLAGDPALRSRLGTAARRRVESEHSLEKMVGRYEQLYASLLTKTSDF